jgi:hypothetical protein
MVLLISERPEGVYLERFNPSGRCVGDTQHDALEVGRCEGELTVAPEVNAIIGSRGSPSLAGAPSPRSYGNRFRGTDCGYHCALGGQPTVRAWPMVVLTFTDQGTAQPQDLYSGSAPFGIADTLMGIRELGHARFPLLHHLRFPLKLRLALLPAPS